MKTSTELRIVTDADEIWEAECPFLTPDGSGGFVIVTEEDVEMCEGCGGKMTQRMSLVCEETKDTWLVSLGMGMSVKHYYTSCHSCNNTSVS